MSRQELEDLRRERRLAELEEKAAAPRNPLTEQQYRQAMSSVSGADPSIGDYASRLVAGVSDLGSGAIQLGATALEKAGVPGAGDFREDYENFRNAYERTAAIDTPGAVGAGVEIAGKLLPAAAVPGGVTGNLLKRTATGAAAGTGIGALEFEGVDDNRLANMVLSGVFGGASPLVFSGGKYLLAEGTKRGLRFGASAKDMAGSIKDFASTGASPTLPQATGSDFLQGIETLVGKYLGGGPVRRAIEKTAGKVSAKLGAIADDLSPVTRGAEESGRVIRNAIKGEGGFVDRFMARSGEMWNRVDDMLGNDMVTVANTKKTLGELVSDGKLASVLNDPKITKISEVMADAGDSIPYSELKKLRTIIGQKLGGDDLVSDVPRSELKRLYGALSRDIEALAKTKGDDAYKLYSRANKFTRSGHDRIDTFVERVVKKDDLDKIFDAVTKGGEGSGVINAFKRSMKPEEWDVVAGNVIRRLGQATAGRQDDVGEVFSLPTLLTQWNKLGPSKKALFSGSGKLNRYSKDLDVIASMANVVKRDMESMANSSGTGQFAANLSTMLAGGAAIGTGNIPMTALILGLVSANNGAARLMTNPRFVRWVASSTKLGAGDLPAHIAKLAIVANDSKTEDVQAIESLISQLSQTAELVQ